MTTVIVSRVPAYRQGLAIGLQEAGFDVHQAESPELPSELHWDACLLRVTRAFDLPELTRLRELQPSAPVIALISGATAGDHRLALHMGVDGAIPYDSSIVEIVNVLNMAFRGKAVLPVDVARALAEPVIDIPDELPLGADEMAWLRALSQGSSVTSIARVAGYSERQMYRLIQQTYRKIGVRNRWQAVALATQWGLTAHQ
ncbi:MAG: hypothetical protein ACRDT0_27015 [Pseudonocardiaceae bacterium]